MSGKFIVLHVLPFSMVDSLQECCHCGENALIIQSVECVDSLLRSIDQLTRGEHITPSLAELIESQFSPADLGKCLVSCREKDNQLLVARFGFKRYLISGKSM